MENKITLKGKTLLVNGVVRAEIFGCRGYHHTLGPSGGYGVRIDGIQVVSRDPGFAYFKDAVKYARYDLEKFLANNPAA